MTSVVVRGLFNAVAFAGAGFLFSKLNGQGYKEEVKRHNQALEKLAKAKEKFYESEVKRRNDEARRRAEILDANKDTEETNRALEDLRDYTRLMDSTASQRRPKLEDYYQPSDEMKRYAVLTMGILGGWWCLRIDTNILNFRNPMDIGKFDVVRRKQLISVVLVLVLFVTFPEESTSLNSTPKICTYKFPALFETMNVNET